MKLFTLTPSINTRVCLDAAPLKKIEVVAPDPPVWTTSNPGRPRRDSKIVISPPSAISSASIMVTEADIPLMGSGWRVAVITISSKSKTITGLSSLSVAPTLVVTESNAMRHKTPS